MLYGNKCEKDKYPKYIFSNIKNEVKEVDGICNYIINIINSLDEVFLNNICPSINENMIFFL